MKDFPDKFKGVAEVLIEKYSKRADAIKKDILEADLKEEDKIYGVKRPSKASKKKKKGKSKRTKKKKAYTKKTKRRSKRRSKRKA